MPLKAAFYNLVQTLLIAPLVRMPCVERRLGLCGRARNPRTMKHPDNQRVALVVVALLFVLVIGHDAVRAQQVVFSVPSVSVLDKDEVYLEAGSVFGAHDPRFFSLSPRVVIGAGNNVEV